LIGCPLNGEWNIKVCDEVGADNGWVYSWELNLDPNLLPQNWQYTVDNDTNYLSGAGVVGQTNSVALVVPVSPGAFDYVFTVVNEYGCSYDTTVSIIVLPTPDPALGPDQHACAGETVTLGTDSCPGCSYDWNTGDKSASITTSVSGIYWRTVTNEENCSATDTIQSVIHSRPAPVNIRHQ